MTPELDRLFQMKKWHTGIVYGMIEVDQESRTVPDGVRERK
jgi:hypothetical protein